MSVFREMELEITNVCKGLKKNNKKGSESSNNKRHLCSIETGSRSNFVLTIEFGFSRRQEFSALFSRSGSKE